MNTARNNSGFTVIEIAVAMISASILVLVVGVMLFYGYIEWLKMREDVEIQREASLAIETMEQRVRESTATRVEAEDGRITFTPVDIFTEPTVSFYLENNDFIYDPNTANDGDEIVMIYDIVTRFVTSNHVIGVSVEMTLSNGEFDAKLDSILAFRN